MPWFHIGFPALMIIAPALFTLLWCLWTGVRGTRPLLLATLVMLLGFGAGLVLQGLGHGLALPSLSSAVANSVPERDLGIASAGNRLTGTVGTAFGITVLTLVYGGENAGPAFQAAFLAGAGFATLSLAAAWFMRDAREESCTDAIRST